MSRGGSSFQMQSIPISPMVKKLIVINVLVWVVLQLILEKLILGSSLITYFFGFTPQNTIENFFVWQPLTYMFLHSENLFHILINMISLWFFGSELEFRWGSKKFLMYYLICGVGAAVIYLFGVILILLFKETPPLVYVTPVIGASGAVFGILLAYAILFGERVIYFFGVFPMQARYFIVLIGGIEMVSLLSSGMGGTGVANLAHLGGIITGYIYLVLWSQSEKAGRNDSKKSKGRRNLRLVVDNEKKKSDKGPKYWN